MTKRSATFAATCSALSLVDGVPPKRIQLFAMGENPTHNGYPRASFVIESVAQASEIIAATKKRLGKSHLMGDYDHQAEATSRLGVKAPASGWIDPETLVAQPDGIWGEVEWTGAASAHIAAKEYRYISPYFHFKPDGRISSIINFALVNVPNFDLAAVASALTHDDDTHEEDNVMSFKAIATALGLAATADEASIIAGITAIKGKADALTATASALGVTTAAASALAAAKVDPAKFVPIATVAEMTATMTALKGQVDGFAKQRRTEMIKAAGDRLPPALKAHAEGIEDETALASFLAGFPENGLGKGMDKKNVPGGDTLTEDERATCSHWGLTEAEYLASRKQLEGAQ
jgi:phage I-like protein